VGAPGVKTPGPASWPAPSIGAGTKQRPHLAVLAAEVSTTSRERAIASGCRRRPDREVG